MDDQRAVPRPNILFISHESKLYGAPLSLLYAIQWFRSRADVQAITVRDGGFADRLRDEGIEVTVLSAPSDYRPGALRGIVDRVRRQLGKLSNAVSIARIARQRRVDLVYVNSVSRLTHILGGWLSGRPVVVHVREVENYLVPDSRLRRLLLAGVLRLPRKFIADSAASRRVLHRVVPGAAVEVVHNGVDPDMIESGDKARSEARQRLGLGQDGRVIGFVGKRSFRKGFDTFHTAAERICRDNDDVRIAIIGERHETLPECGIDVAGWVEHDFIDDIGAVYCAFDIFVMASRQEPFARVNLEASAAGCAVVATAVDGNLELFEPEQTALLVPAGDVAALTAALQRLVDDAELIRTLGDAGREKVLEYYTLELCHQRILKAIESLLPPAASAETGTKQTHMPTKPESIDRG